MKFFHVSKYQFGDIEEYVENRNPRCDFGQKLYMFLNYQSAKLYAQRTKRSLILTGYFKGDMIDLFTKANNHYHLTTFDFGSVDNILNDDELKLLWISTVLYNREGVINSYGYIDTDIMLGPIADAVTNTLTRNFVKTKKINSKKDLLELFEQMNITLYGDQLAFSKQAASIFLPYPEEYEWTYS